MDDFLQCLRSPDPSSRWGQGTTDVSDSYPPWILQVLPSAAIGLTLHSRQEIELFDSDLEIFRGKGGYLAVRPVKIFLCVQSPL